VLAAFDEIDKLIDPFDGYCDSCGAVGDDYVPFSFYLNYPRRTVPEEFIFWWT
jgi:hypothetical protein